jgi:hypothetical protein
LREGRAYGVRARDHAGTLHLASLRMLQDTLQVRVSGRVTGIRVVGQGGRTIARWERTGTDSTAGHRWRDTVVELRAVASPADGYVRVVAYGAHESLFSNPVVRWDGTALPSGLASINRPRTVLSQTAWRLSLVWIVLWLAASSRYPRTRRLAEANPGLATG